MGLKNLYTRISDGLAERRKSSREYTRKKEYEREKHNYELEMHQDYGDYAQDPEGAMGRYKGRFPD